MHIVSIQTLTSTVFYVCVCFLFFLVHQPAHSRVEGDFIEMIKLLYPAVEIPLSAGSLHVRGGKVRYILIYPAYLFRSLIQVIGYPTADQPQTGKQDVGDRKL